MVGLGIAFLLIGVPIGIMMLRKPREMWHATEGWKFRNPEANEPSGAVLMLSGLGVLGGSLVFGLLAVAAGLTGDDEKQSKPARSAPTYSYPSRASLPPQPFTPGPPQNRGALTVFGYTVDGSGTATVYYYAPPALPEAGPEPSACYVTPKVEGLGTEHVTVAVDLMWAAKQQSDLAKGYDCQVRANQKLVSRALVIGKVSATAELSTPTPPNYPTPTTPLVRYATPPLGYSGL